MAVSSKQLVQYGAVVAGAAAIPAVASGISASLARADWIANNVDVIGGGQATANWAASSVADAGTSAMSSAWNSTVQSPQFLTSVGLGLAGLILGSGSKTPSLNLPNLGASAAVALSVASLLKQGKAALAEAEKRKTAIGGTMGRAPANFKTTAAVDPNLKVALERDKSNPLFISFPKTLTEDYWMRFSIRAYDRKLTTTNDSSKSGDFHTVIKLPLPAAMVDAIKLIYQDAALGIFGGPMIDKVGKPAYDAFNAAGSTSAGIKAGASAALGGMSSILSQDGAKAAMVRKLLTNSDMGRAFDLITGNAPNPHMAVSFGGVNLKKHVFTWRFSPDSFEESKALETIIRQLQAAALPGMEGTHGLLLKFPDIVIVEMNPSNLIPFKPCSIDSIGINYAPNGVPSFFRPPPGGTGGADAGNRYPTEVEMTMSLRELDIHTNDMPFYWATRQGQINTEKALAETKAAAPSSPGQTAQ